MKILNRYILKVSTKLSRCKIVNAGTKLLELIWVNTDKSVESNSQEHLIETVCQGIQDEEARQDSKNFTCFSVVLCNATTSNRDSVGLNHDIC